MSTIVVDLCLFRYRQTLKNVNSCPPIHLRSSCLKFLLSCKLRWHWLHPHWSFMATAINILHVYNCNNKKHNDINLPGAVYNYFCFNTVFYISLTLALMNTARNPIHQMSDIKTAPIAIRYIVYNMFDNKCARDALTASYSCCTTHHTLVLQRWDRRI